jgi:biopolymer transport protein ExbD
VGASGGDGDDQGFTDINITPFVDIILVVLIIFMVTATTIVKSSIQVALPDAATGEKGAQTSLGIMLTEDGRLLLDGNPTDAQGVKDALTQAKATGNEVVVLIAADRRVDHGRVVWVLDLLRSEGVAKFAIQIDEATSVPPDPG